MKTCFVKTSTRCRKAKQRFKQASLPGQPQSYKKHVLEAFAGYVAKAKTKELEHNS